MSLIDRLKRTWTRRHRHGRHAIEWAADQAYMADTMQIDVIPEPDEAAIRERMLTRLRQKRAAGNAEIHLLMAERMLEGGIPTPGRRTPRAGALSGREWASGLDRDLPRLYEPAPIIDPALADRPRDEDNERTVPLRDSRLRLARYVSEYRSAQR